MPSTPSSLSISSGFITRLLRQVLIAPPSPLVGEGITGVRPAFDRVRGCQPREPLTRLRFAKAPSPTREEGKMPAIQRRQTS